MADVAHWTCPDCGYEIEGQAVADFTFGERIEAHEREHVERLVVAELEPSVVERLQEIQRRCREQKADASDAETLSEVIDRLAEGFESHGHIVLLSDRAVMRLSEMAEALAAESRPIYAGVLARIVRQARQDHPGGSE
jgi:hypothetical protein